MSTFRARCLCDGPRARARVASITKDARASIVNDPTGTLPLQRRFQRELDRRWTVLKKMLAGGVARYVDPTTSIAQSALTGEDPVRAFQSWVDEAMRQIILGSNGAWTLGYVRQASDMGLLHARSAEAPQPSSADRDFSAERFRAEDAFDPNQPRDDHGQWTTGGPDLHFWQHGTASTKYSAPPRELNGIPFSSYEAPEDWSTVSGTNDEIFEPPIPELPKGVHMAAGVVATEPDGRAWLVKPTKGFGGYRYTFPKGTVEAGLTPQQTAIKEMYEETGLKVRITGFVDDFAGDTSLTRMYRAVREAGNPDDHGHEAEAVVLARREDLDKLLNRTRDKLIAARVHDAFDPDQPRGPDGQWIETGGALKVYHGTTNDVAKKILRDGIKIRQAPSYSDDGLYHDERGRSVYVARDEAIAEYYARERVRNRGGTPVIFEIHVPKDKWQSFKNDELSSFGTKYGAATSTKSIPKEWIVGHRVLKDAVDDYVTLYLVVDTGNVHDAAPEPVDRTPVLQSLAVTELQGIVEAVSQQLVRIFAEGALLKRSPSAIAGQMRSSVDKVGVQRGHLLCSFIVVRAFSAATLDGLRARGFSHVGIVPESRPPVAMQTDAKSRSPRLRGLVEVLTAGDDSVCPQCEDISEQGPYSLDEAESLIPAHPRCRCAFVPAHDARFAPVHDAFNPYEPRDQRGRWTTGGKLDIETDDWGAPTGPDAKKYESIEWYSSVGYAPINKGLRGGRLSGRAARAVKDIDSVMRTSRTKKALTVWRGIMPTSKLSIDMFREGKTITLRGYTSTSASKSISRDFAEGISLRIDVPRGSNALEIKGEERELLLPRNSRFKVISVKQASDSEYDLRPDTVHLRLVK